MSTKKKLYIKTWGCQMNEYDSSKISDLLSVNNKYTLTKFEEEADLLILNTCSIREKAQEKLFHQLGRWKKLKKQNPKIIIGVGGCVASQEGKEIFKRSNNIDILFGPQTLHRLPKMLKDFQCVKKPVIDISFPKIEKFDHFLHSQCNTYTASVSIMEGCSKYCSFCIVPFTRGEEISRPCDDIIFEIVQLAKQGVCEINLLGQNVNAYVGKTFDNKKCSFSELLYLISAIEGINRIKFITSHPIDFTDDIIMAYRNIPKLTNFLHLPVQSGSDRILKLMKRGYTIQEYKNIIKKLISVRPNMQITSDFIIGFPGENKQDFEETLNLIHELNFDMSFSFIYSPRPGTPASNLEDHVPLEEKKKRLYTLQKIIYQKALNWSRRMLGSIQNILVEKIDEKNNLKLLGRTENNRIVSFYGEKNLIGKFINVKIIKTNLYHLKGNIVNV